MYEIHMFENRCFCSHNSYVSVGPPLWSGLNNSFIDYIDRWRILQTLWAFLQSFMVLRGLHLMTSGGILMVSTGLRSHIDFKRCSLHPQRAVEECMLKQNFFQIQMDLGHFSLLNKVDKWLKFQFHSNATFWTVYLLLSRLKIDFLIMASPWMDYILFLQ